MVNDELINGTEDGLNLEEAEAQLVQYIGSTCKLWKRPRVTLKDGVSMSIQASGFHYSEPRKSGLSKYESYEVGYPSDVIEQLIPYAECMSEDREELLNTVYGYVPHEVLVDVVREHGGLEIAIPEQAKAQLDELSEEKQAEVDKNQQVAQLINEMMAKIMDVMGNGEN